MKTRFYSFVLLLVTAIFISVNLQAQFIKGQVVNSQTEPVPYVSIFIKEMAMGTSTNEKGEFEIKAPAGKYTCSFQHLSYETITKTIHVPVSSKVIITLPDKVYDLPMVTIGKSKEDPAYDMIRKAVGMAPFYMNQLSKYNAEVYIKGSIVIEKISGLVKAMAGKELKEMKFKVGDKYLQESINEIEYDKGRYKQTVKSISNTFPDEMEVGEIGLMNYNIYSPENRGMVSPISPQAFSYYNYKYEGFSVEGKYIVNRIKVTPKHKSAMTFDGYIYVSDGYWNVHRFELSSENMGIKATSRQAYGELEDNVWMPISNNVDVDVSVLGNKGSGTYVSSIRYKSYVVNPQSAQGFGRNEIADSAKVNAVKISALTEEQQRAADKSKEIARNIESIMNKGTMNNRDAYRISRLMRKKEKEDNKLLPDSLRIKDPLDLSNRYQQVVDSAARNKDADYWNEVRPMPLMDDEELSYKRRDSIKQKQSATDSTGQRKKSAGKYIMGFIGGDYYKVDSSFTIGYDGLVNPELVGFNLVDGLTYKQKISLYKRFKDTTSLRVALEGEYAFKRKRFMFNANAHYGYWPERQGSILVTGGVHSADFNYESGLGNLDNMITTLLFRKNYKNYFENRYIALNHSLELTNGLMSNIGLMYSNRKQLENTSDYSFFYKNSRDFRPNIPLQNAYVADNNQLVNNHTAAIVGISLSYTPQQYYTKRGRSKRYRGSNYPTFSLSWRKGIKGVFNSESDFDQLELSVRQSKNMGTMTSFRYNVTAGWFPNNANMHFRDFKDFDVKESEFLFSSFQNNLALLKTYSAATNEWYASASAQYTSPYLLLKYLPLLNRTMIQENLYFRYLTTPYVKNYTQLGYSLSNIWVVGSIGAFVSFEKFKYSDWGVKIILNLSDF